MSIGRGDGICIIVVRHGSVTFTVRVLVLVRVGKLVTLATRVTVYVPI
jgi:hypothetical protein